MDTAEPILETRLVPPRPLEAALARTFTVGAVLAKTASVWWRHVLAFTVMSAVVYAPLAATFGLFLSAAWTSAGGAPRPDQVPRLAVAVALVSLVTVVLAVIQAGAVTYGTVRHLSGRRARLGDMLRAGFRRGLPVVGVGIVVWLGIVVGTMLLIVPGVMFMVAACVAIPAAVVEKPGLVGAVRRSFALTRGHRWALFAAGFVVLLALWALAAVVQVIAVVVSTALLPPPQSAVGVVIASQLGNVFFSALPLIGISVAYHELRVEKEGVDTSALAKVFE